MKDKIEKRFLFRKSLFLLAGILFIFGLALALAIQPAVASSPDQGVLLQATATQAGDGYPVLTPSVTAEMVTQTATATSAATATVTATAPAQVITATPTTAGTLPPPAVTGTPTQLVPVTGADLNQSNPGGPANLAAWVALWVLGLLLVAFGLKARLDRQK